MLLTPKIITEIQDHAITDYPREACGVIKNGNYFPMVNVSSTPEKSFKIADYKIAKILPIEAVFHSHPDGPDCPSRADMVTQAALAVPFIVLSTDGSTTTDHFILDPSAPPAPLEDRIFRHGITDCYSIVRDFYKIKRGIILPDYPRDWEWWDDEKNNLYTDKFTDAGFRVLSENEEPEYSDVFMIKTPRSMAVNHAGVYLGDGLGIHHLTSKHAYDPNCLSNKFPISRWQHYINLWVRYDG